MGDGFSRLLLADAIVGMLFITVHPVQHFNISQILVIPTCHYYHYYCIPDFYTAK